MVGLGMGHPIARHLHMAGHEVTCFDISELARERAEVADLCVVATLHELAGAQLVCSSLPATADVEAVYEEVFGWLDAGSVCADLSTISVHASQRLAQQAVAAGFHFLDAPVSGTSIHAEAGNLVVMVGGEAAALNIARPALEAFASRVDHVGGSGSGLLLKLITNRLLTSHLTAIAEAVVEMEAVGLDVWHGIDLIRSGAVPKLLDYKAEALVDRDFTPAFTVALMCKDLRLAAEALPELPVGSLTKEILDTVAAAGRGDEDLAALITALEKEHP